MKQNRLSLNTKTVIIYLIIIAGILDTATMYSYVTTSPLYLRGLGWAMGVLCLLYVIQSKRIRISKSSISLFLFLLLYLALYIVFSRVNTQDYLVGFFGVFFCLFIFAYCLYQNDEVHSFIVSFSNVMVLIASVSLFFWVFGSLLNVLPGRAMRTYYWAEHYRTTYTYYYLYFENPIQNIGHGTVCNLAIFTEAPGYSGFLTYGLLCELVLKNTAKTKKEKRNNLARIILFIITLISTNSTKGIIAVLIAVFIDYISKNTTSRIIKAVRICLSAVLLITVSYVGFILIESKLGTESGIVRMDDMLAGLKAFAHHPILGVGYNNADGIINYQLVSRSNKGLSMGLSTLLGFGGLWLFFFYLGAVISSFRIPFFYTHKKVWALVILVLLYNLFVSNSGFTNPYIFMIAAAYAIPRKVIEKNSNISN